MNTFLVTGGAGFIGSNLCEKLAAGGHGVRVLDDLSTGLVENLRGLEGSVELVRGDIRDRATAREAVRGMDFVIHLAALGSVPRSVEDPETTHDVNATGTLVMLNAAREAGVRRFVYASSSSVYGDTPVLPKIETMDANPQSPYAVSKLAGEYYCRVFHRVYGLETVSLRYFNVYGRRQRPDSQYAAVIPLFVSAVLRGESPTINGDGEQTRDFTFVDDCNQANIKACFA
ncbi:MAG: NAD-dependent epimerase/dehydratase family protein, partial [Thermodesulfobacteriota bacterium]